MLRSYSADNDNYISKGRCHAMHFLVVAINDLAHYSIHASSKHLPVVNFHLVISY